MPITVTRTNTVLRPDQTRVLLRPFNPGSPQRMASIIARIMLLPERRVGPLLDEVSAEFSVGTSTSGESSWSALSKCAASWRATK